MVEDWEIWGCANTLIMQHGDKSSDKARGFCDAMIRKGDQEDYVVWQRIIRAIEGLQKEPPADQSRLH